MKLSAKQKEFWNNANHRWNIKCGATRSGKTYLDYFLIPKRIKNAGSKGIILIMGHTKNTVERNILAPMRNIYGKSLVGRVTGNNTVNLFGRNCFVLGADKACQASRLQGAGVEYCYGDEITTWSEAVFNMLKSRLDKPTSLFDGTCNPDSPSHWFKNFLDSDADIFCQNYTIDDNPFLSKSFVDNLKKEYAGTVLYDRYILGKWTRAEGLVYPMFSPDIHITDNFPPFKDYYVSIDYGTLNPCSMGLWGISKDNIAYRVKEFYHNGRDNSLLTDEEYCDKLEELTADTDVRAVIVDPSASSFITAIKRRGRFPVRKANNSVLDGIRNVSSCLSGGQLMFSPKCKDTIREFSSYSWDTEKGSDTVIKENDHAMDDMRYFVSTILKKRSK
ncbi:MAG: PBSX family phage terminase large subunit [Clostridia bacterium]|nr:PBSX family phage terminase large subunit [Clostridia bacterium]